MWAQRVAVFEYLFACLLKGETDPERIVADFAAYGEYGELTDWQAKIVADFARRFGEYAELVRGALRTKWSFEDFDNVAKAAILEAVAERNAHGTDKAVLIDQALITVGRYGDAHLKGIVNAVLDRILR